MGKKRVGVLTAGGDCPGLNAAIRGIGKALLFNFDTELVGFYDGFRGLMEDRHELLDGQRLSNILTVGGTILGTSRDKPQRMLVGGKERDMTDAMLEVAARHKLQALVCIGGGGTQKNAYRLSQKGLRVITLPKTIDNDVFGSDVTFGFDTAMGVATDAIDRLHTTAHSHHRIIVVEVMGHRTGWLTLGSGLAGGADVILVPEIPYDVNHIAAAILRRRKAGKHFSIVAVAEGACSLEEAATLHAAEAARASAGNKKEKAAAEAALAAFDSRIDHALQLSQQLEKLTALEARITILGHLQRGGIPSPADRALATQLGTACAQMIQDGLGGVMVALRDGAVVPVPLEEIVGRRKCVPLDHPWLDSARLVGTCLGDR